MIGVVKMIGVLLALEIVAALVSATITGIATLLLDRLLFRDVEPEDLPLAEAKVVRR